MNITAFGSFGGTHAAKTAPEAKPVRIQRRRVKGWRMPPDTIYVGRGSPWGNPFRVGRRFPVLERGGYQPGRCIKVICTAREAVDAFRDLMETGREGLDLAELRGKNLACWCPLDAPCHADVLLEMANG